MYGYPQYPMIFPPQQGDQQKHFELGMKMAEKLIAREAREKERTERMKRQNDITSRKDAAARRSRTLISIEWYILGILSYPLWAPLYQMAILKAQNP